MGRGEAGLEQGLAHCCCKPALVLVRQTLKAAGSGLGPVPQLLAQRSSCEEQDRSTSESSRRFPCTTAKGELGGDATLLAHAEVKADVKRCHALREALTLLDFDDESIDDIRRYLLRAAFSPAFLRVAEGRRFIGFLFTLHPQMVRPPPAARGTLREAATALRCSERSSHQILCFSDVIIRWACHSF